MTSWINNLQQGFTLMELLVAMSLLGLVFAIIFQAFSLGIKAWEKGETIQAKQQQLRAALSFIGDQVSSAYPLRVKDEVGGESYLAFEGKESSLEFITSLSLSQEMKGGLLFTTYFLNEDNTTDTKTLMASERDILTKGFFAEAKKARTKNEGAFDLIPGITELKFTYFDSSEPDQGWKEEWGGKKRGKLPHAIKVSLKFKDDQADPINTLVIPINIDSKFDGLAGLKIFNPSR